MADPPWNKWLTDATDRARDLLLAASADKQAALARRTGAAAGDILKARKLQKTIAATIARGDAASWRRLAIAFDVIDIAGIVEDDEPSWSGSVDTTMPEATPMTTASKTEARGSHHSIDETVTIGEMRIDLGEVPTPPTPANPRAGATLAAGEVPPTAVTREHATVQLPIRMPAQVTPTSAAASSNAGLKGGTTPMEPVPSSVLDIEKYAVLCAWTQVHPEKRDRLHQQYGLSTEDGRRELDERFAELFAKNARLKSVFEKRLRLHLGFLKR